MKNTEYHSDWQNNRIKFLIDTYGHSFFENKKILELGSHNGYIGNYFIEKCGANVLSVEGRKENVKKINDEGVEIEIDLTNSLTISQISDYLKELETDSLEDVFFENIEEEYLKIFEKPVIVNNFVETKIPLSENKEVEIRRTNYLVSLLSDDRNKLLKYLQHIGQYFSFDLSNEGNK